MKPRRTSHGFTLTELLVTMVIVAVTGLAGLGYYRSQMRVLSTHSATLEATDKVRAAMAFVSRELREAGYDRNATALTTIGFKGIRYAGPNGIWIEFDQSGSGAIDPNAADPYAESIIYSYDSTNRQILRTVAGVSQTLVEDVPAGSFTFQYYDAAGIPLAMDTAASLSPVPAGYPSVPSPVSQALTGGGTQMVSAANRDLIALVRVNLQVETVGTTPTTSLSLSARVSVPNRLLDRL